MITTHAFPKPLHTQTPNRFFEMIPDMSEAELRVTLVMIRQTFGFHRGDFKMGVSKIAAAAGLSRQGTLDGAAAAEKRGTFRRSNPETITEAEWELVLLDPSNELIPTLQPVEVNPQDGRGQVGVKESINKESNKDPFFEVLTKPNHNELKEQEATHAFESSFGFGSLPWHSKTVWSKMAKFVTAIFESDQLAFGNYIAWRGGEGKYKAMSNTKIRLNPEVFMDTGWPDFEQSKPAPEKPREFPPVPDYSDAVPNPGRKPAILAKYSQGAK